MMVLMLVAGCADEAAQPRTADPTADPTDTDPNGTDGPSPTHAGHSNETATAAPSAPASPTAPSSPLAPSGPFGTGRLALHGPDGEVVELDVYVADEPALRQRGLMGVEDLPDGAGMVFHFETDTQVGFIMRNTLIPLTVAFFSTDGELLAMLDMEPCEAEPCPVYDPEVTYRTALEVDQGALTAAGVVEGWTLELDA